jgi:hypothetical protein
MANDTFIYFEKGRKPSKKDIQKTLEDYMEGIATEIRWEKDRFFVRLPGTCRHPLQRVLPLDMAHVWRQFAEDPRERWIEVWINKKTGTIDVMTRMSDRITNAIAQGYAQVIAKWWSGRIEK